MRTTHALIPLPPPRLRPGRRPHLAAAGAHLRAPWIDKQLAAGALPWSSRVLAARSVQLTSDRRRRALARALERLVKHSERASAPFRGAAIQPCREQVRRALPLILAIASSLRSGRPIDARGVAQLLELLTDGTGPCYAYVGPDALATELQSVSDRLEVEA
jgi:hypothetical protein